ncbi:MAG: response regulator [Parvibaculaceae bacterium]
MARNIFETLTVLVVDDSSHMRHLMLGLLRALGVGEVVLANDGEDAWSKFLIHKPDLVITDAAMPTTDGFALARRLRESDAITARHIPIIMISAHTEISAIERAREVGITEFVRKPLVPRTLYERLIAVINRKQEAAIIAAAPAAPVTFL